MMYYIYGAYGSKSTRKAELLLIVCRRPYKLFLLGIDYSREQLHKLQPETDFVPHIYHHTTYIGGVNELHDYLYCELKTEKEPTKKEL